MSDDESKDAVPVKVVYCGVCGLPPEYCKWGKSFERCKPWLRANAPELYPDLFGDEPAGGAPEEADVDGAVKGVEGLAVDEAEAEAGAGGGAEGGAAADAGAGAGGGGGKKKNKGGKKGKGADPKIVISRKDRNKRKHVTIIAGLDTLPGLKIKDVAKTFGKKFSCGSSVSNTATGGKEIDIQGDFMDDIPALLVELFSIPKEFIYLQDGARTVRANID